MPFAPGFTPTLVLSIPEETEDLTAVDEIHVTVEGGGCRIDKSGADVTVLSATEIEFTLTQTETLQMWGRSVTIQINWLYPGTLLRWGTEVSAPITLDEQLLPEVLNRGQP